jgi:hypothetical protein
LIANDASVRFPIIDGIPRFTEPLGTRRTGGLLPPALRARTRRAWPRPAS